MAGHSLSGADGNKSQPSRGGRDFWVVKTDENGNKIWDKRFGGSNDELAMAVAAVPGGGYVIAGYSLSGANGDKSELSRGGYDFWLVKIDENGDKIWDKRFGGTGEDYAYSIVHAPGGGYVVAGATNSGANGDVSQPSQGTQDYWLVKIDEDGTKIWDKRFGSNVAESAYSIAAAASGGYLVLGYTNAQPGGDVSQPSKGGQDFWLVRVDENGNKIWDKRFGGSLDDRGQSVVASPDGGFVLAGLTFSPADGDLSQPSQGSSDFWTIKINTDGNLVWEKRFGGSNPESVNRVTVLPGGGYLFAGPSTSGAEGDKSEISQGGDDFWIVKTDETGTKIWDKRFGGSGTDRARSVAVLPSGGYVVTGESSSDVDGDKTQPTQGSSDYWLVRFTDCSSGPPQFIVQLTPSGAVCPGAEVELVAQSDSAYVYTWQPGNLTGNTISIAPTVTTIYTILAVGNGGCFVYQTIEVPVAPTVPEIIYLSMNFGDTLTLSPGGGTAFRWLPVGDTTETIQVTEPGTYLASVSYGSCGRRFQFVVDTSGVVAGISGSVYVDSNENGQRDAEEPPVPNRPVFLLKPTGEWVSTTSSDSSGFYWAPWPATGSYRVKVQPLSTEIPISEPNLQGEYNETISNLAEIRASRNFGFKAYTDVSVTVAPVGFFRPGFAWRLRVQYCNNGNNTINAGEVSVLVDPILEYAGQTVFPYAVLEPGECRWIDLTGIVPVSTQNQLGAPVTGKAMIVPMIDEKPENNEFSYVGAIQGSYDPNDKTTFVEGRTSGEYAMEGERIEYRVRFQNTGTDTAFTVVVRDTLDTTILDLTTIELVGTSHPVHFRLRGSTAVWQFDNILLPDSNTNEALSHGWIVFRVNSRTGNSCDTQTENRVSIYFDFNDPVVTDYAITTLNPTPQPEIIVESVSETTVSLRAAARPFAQTYEWDFGSGASPATAAGPGPHTVVYVGNTNPEPVLTAVNTTTGSKVCEGTTRKTLTLTPTYTRKNEESEFRVWPNPTTGRLVIHWASSYGNQAKMSLYSITGQLVLSKILKSQYGRPTAELHLSDLPAGVYRLRLDTETDTRNLQLVLE